MVDPSERMDTFNELERTFPVDTWRINDIHVWPLLRNQIAAAINKVNRKEREKQQVEDSNKAAPVSKLTSYIRIKLRPAINVAKQPFYALKFGFIRRKLHKANFDLLFLAVTSTKVELLNKWFDIQNDPFLWHLKDTNISSLVMERDNGAPFQNSLFFPDNHVNLDQYVSGTLWKYRKDDSNNSLDLERYREFSDRIKDRFRGYNLEEVVSIEKLTEQIVNIQSLSRMFSEIIRNNGIKMCFITNIDTFIGMSLIYACRQLQIPSVDLQHGIQGDLHCGYNGWHNLPKQGYSTLPSIFWNWSKEQQEHIRKWAVNTDNMHRSIVGGNAWVNMWRKDQNKLGNYFKTEIEAIKKDDDNQVHILYTMQPGLADVLPERVIEAYYNSPSNWRWWFRLHPRQMDKRTEIIDGVRKVIPINEADILLPSALPLPLLLQFTNVHVTPSSSVVLEAEFFKVASVVTDPKAPAAYKDQVEDGSILYSDDKNDDLIAAIHQQLKFKFKPIDEVDTFEEFDKLLQSYGLGK